MEKPVPTPTLQSPLTISHHDERLAFPGYDVTAGKGYLGQEEEHGKNPYTARDHVDEAELPNEGQSRGDVVWYKKHKRKLVVAAIIWFAAFFLISLPLHRTSETQSSHRVKFFTPCNKSLPSQILFTYHASTKQPPCPCWPDRLHLR